MYFIQDSLKMMASHYKHGNEMLPAVERLEALPVINYDTSLDVDKVAEYLAKIKNNKIVSISAYKR